MRLHPAELSAIRSTLGALDPLGRIYLYGSRADDAKRGGDIDLFLEASHALDMKTVLATQYRLSSACDTRVDLLSKAPDEADMPIRQIARQGIQL